MPQIVEATLMPFRDVIIHDGIVAPYGVCLGRNMSEQSKQTYLAANQMVIYTMTYEWTIAQQEIKRLKVEGEQHG